MTEHTLMLDEMGGVGQQMRKIFAMFTTCSMASLALPGMSGFVAELMVFVGFSNSDAYYNTFKLIVVFLIGVILTPIYLLSMLREIFYGAENNFAHEALVDAEPERYLSLPVCWCHWLALVCILRCSPRSTTLQLCS